MVAVLAVGCSRHPCWVPDATNTTAVSARGWSNQNMPQVLHELQKAQDYCCKWSDRTWLNTCRFDSLSRPV